MKNLNSFIKLSAISLGLAVCASSFAQKSTDTSIVDAIKNNAASNNTASSTDNGPSATAMKKGSNQNGRDNDSNGDTHSNCHTGSKGRGAGGNDKGEDCGPHGVPEPVSMLVLGAGTLAVALRKRRARA